MPAATPEDLWILRSGGDVHAHLGALDREGMRRRAHVVESQGAARVHLHTRRSVGEVIHLHGG